MGRDLRLRKEVTMHRVSRLKPVVIDESLTDLDMFMFAKQQGYSGIAIKACKGISDSLLFAAAAKHYNLKCYVQDLTCIGASFLASAAMASRIAGLKAVEGNGRQYCPSGNKDWESLYRPCSGCSVELCPPNCLMALVSVSLGRATFSPRSMRRSLKGEFSDVRIVGRFSRGSAWNLQRSKWQGSDDPCRLGPLATR